MWSYVNSLIFPFIFSFYFPFLWFFSFCLWLFFHLRRRKKDRIKKSECNQKNSSEEEVVNGDELLSSSEEEFNHLTDYGHALQCFHYATFASLLLLISLRFLICFFFSLYFFSFCFSPMMPKFFIIICLNSKFCKYYLTNECVTIVIHLYNWRFLWS